MRTTRALYAVFALALTLAVVGCNTGFEITPSPESTSTPRPRPTSIEGPSCPEGFEENRVITEEIEVDASSHLTLTLGSTPSIPCGWQTLEIAESSVLRQVTHGKNWPAEGVTPAPGAPGTEVWGLEVLKPGETTVSVACICLGDEGDEDVLRGRFVLDVRID
jgi:predicted secreted protein